MKKIKKGALIISGIFFSLSAVPISIIGNSYDNKNEKIKNYFSVVNESSENINKILSNKDDGDLMEIKKEINNFFNTGYENKVEIKKSLVISKNNNSIFESDNEILDTKILNDVKNKSLEYFDLFVNDKFSFLDLLAMANDSGYTYEEQLADLENIKNNESDKSLIKSTNLHAKVNTYGNNSNSEKEKKSFSFVIEKFRDAGIRSASFFAAAAAIAAGYWCLSFWTAGATVSSAIAATAQATVFAVEGAIYGGYYETLKNSKDYKSIKDLEIFNYYFGTLSWSANFGLIAQSVKSFVKNMRMAFSAIRFSTIAIKSGVLATFWAAPTGLVFLTIAEVILNACNLVFSAPF